MHHRHRAIGSEEESSHRLADNVGAAEHDRLGAGQVFMHRMKEQKAALRGARNETCEATPQASDIDRVEAVHVLGGIDRRDDRLRIDLPRQRKLDQYPVDAVVTVQSFDLGNKAGFRDAGG